MSLDQSTSPSGSLTGRQAYFLGLHGTLEHFVERKGKIVEALRQHPHLIPRVIDRWPVNRTAEVIDPLLDAIADKPKLAYRAGLARPRSFMDDQRLRHLIAFIPPPSNLDRLIADISASPFWCYKALRHWPYGRLKLGQTRQLARRVATNPRLSYSAYFHGGAVTDPTIIPILVNGIAENPSICHQFMRQLTSLERDRYSSQILPPLLASAHWCYMTKDWGLPVFLDHAQKITTTLSTSTGYSRRALRDWPLNRAERLIWALEDQMPVPPRLGPAYPPLESGEDRRFWWLTRLHMGDAALEALSPPDIPLLRQAYAFAVQTGQDKAYFAGLKKSLNDGTVREWAQAILAHFQSANHGESCMLVLEGAR